MNTQRTVVLIHGFLGGPGDWDPISSTSWFDVAERVTLAGHASFEGAEPLTFDGEVADIHDEIFRNASLPVDEGDCADFCGYSMGGRLVYGVLAKWPHRVRRFVALGARAARADPARAERDEAWAAMLETKGLWTFLQAWYAQALFESFRASERFDELVEERLATHNPLWLAKAIRAFSPARQPDFTEVLRTTDRPGLLIAGERDTFYVEQNAELARANPHLQAAVIPDAGHALLAEAPEAVAQLLEGFLA